MAGRPCGLDGTADRAAALSDEQHRALKFWVKLARAHSAIAGQATADISRHGLTLAEFGILEVLYHRGPMLLGEVQRRILVSSGGITFLVDRLTAKGLVERRACDTDRRARYATLTDRACGWWRRFSQSTRTPSCVPLAGSMGLNSKQRRHCCERWGSPPRARQFPHQADNLSEISVALDNI